MIDELLRLSLLLISNTLAIFIAIYICFSRKIINAIMAMALFSLNIMFWYCFINAPDVAMTEAAANVTISTLISVLALKKIDIKQKTHNNYYIALFSIILLTICFYDLFPNFDLGNSQQPANLNAYYDYIKHTIINININSIVAAILASYRGFDTFAETMVIFIAGSAISSIMSINYQNDPYHER
jgi:multicomponent Na+:H+ antiporter subunit B